MAKTRLNSSMRMALRDLAHKIVMPRKESKALVAAYDRAAPLVRKAVENKYPTGDMLILKQYEQASFDDTIRVSCPDGRVTEFIFWDKTGPLVPGRPGRGCESRMYLIDDKTARAVSAWEQANEHYKETRRVRIAAYKSLIISARYVEDITAVWPDAAEHIPKSNEVMVLTDDLLSVIQQDIRERAAA